MKIIIDYSGKTYDCMAVSGYTVDEYTNALFEHIESATKFRIPLVSGGYLILGREAIQRAAIMVVP